MKRPSAYQGMLKYAGRKSGKGSSRRSGGGQKVGLTRIGIQSNSAILISHCIRGRRLRWRGRSKKQSQCNKIDSKTKSLKYNKPANQQQYLSTQKVKATPHQTQSGFCTLVRPGPSKEIIGYCSKGLLSSISSKISLNSQPAPSTYHLQLSRNALNNTKRGDRPTWRESHNS
ncbi:hypothetical protein FGO68_gene3192 [Halteria grandinella]|uniref:Uncharacterized protein n=1 Tax=Halteria grandinella TaxID=5974 RepID=A0A8J8NJ55_HALGN|nr:hypothetical protein FGO68_gene3192 [Halteria grandinella]